MKERPILMSGAMVRATLREIDPKTQTRRVVKHSPAPWNPDHTAWDMSRCPYGQPVDHLWVRENGWERPERTLKMMREGADTWEPYYFDADGYTDIEHEQFKEWGFKRRPSIHMPRWASRILLEITGVRVERLQDISPDDAIAEGIVRNKPNNLAIFTVPETHIEKLGSVAAYAALWESINGPGSWDANPWVWVIEFKRVKP